MSQDVLVQKSVEARNPKQSYKPRAKTGIDSLKDKFSNQLTMLCELFPTWNEDDLVAVIAELNGDLELAIDRISEGHADQWSSTGKKAPKKEAPKSRYNSSESKFQKKRFDSSNPSAKASATPQPFVKADVTIEKATSWAEASWTETKSFVPAVEAVQVSVAPVEAVEEKTVEVVEAPKDEEAPPKKFVSINSGKQREPREKSQNKKNSFDMKTLESSLVAEEEAVVLLPNIRRHLAPEIEPSPVLLPLSIGLKSCGNIKFGQSITSTSKGQLFFGESQTNLPSSPSEDSVGVSANPSGYTTTSIDALPSPLESPYAAQPYQESPFTSSPPGLSTPNVPTNSNTMNYYQNAGNSRYSQNQAQQQLRAQQGFEQMDSSRVPYPHYHHRQAYDPYNQQQTSQSRYEIPFNSRYGPYGTIQPSIDDSFAAPNYYGGRAAQNSYYPYSQQMMYGSEAGYAVGSTSSNFTPASARYQPSSNPNQAGNYGAQHHHQQQQQQQHYSSYSPASGQQASASSAFPANPANRSPSRMF